MPMTALTAAFATLKGASDGAKTLLDLHERGAIERAVNDLRTQLSAALGSVIDARIEYAAHLDRVKELEAQIAEFDRWDAEAANYELKEIGRGALVYVLKAESKGSSPAHYLCANCYGTRKKSILQISGRYDGYRGGYPRQCPICKTVIVAPNESHATDPAPETAP